MRNVAVVLAGGVGSRVGLTIPKQLIKVAGRAIVEHTIDVFEQSGDVDDIVIMMTPGYLDDINRIVRSGNFSKVTRVMEGATTRNGTTALAIEAVSELLVASGESECNVLFHDAVRPLVSQRIISDVVKALARFEAVDTAIPSADTIVSVHSTDVQPAVHGYETIADVLPRHLLRRGQTPQAFRLSTIRQAYALATQDPDFQATDDCTVVLRYLPDVPIAVVAGAEQNMKVTEPIDLFIADKLFQLTEHDAPERMTDDQYRERLTGKTVVVLGGSYGIGRDIGRLAADYGANVVSFSRSSTGTHVERREDIIKAREAALEQTGRVDFVVHTAGVLHRGNLVDVSEETLHAVTDVNYISPILVAQEFFPELAKTRGSLLLFTSSSYTRGRAGYSLYSSAKAAVVNLTQALADEWAASGVRVNCINPERTGTPMRTNAFGVEPPGSLLSSEKVAASSIDVLIGDLTGHTIDVRRVDPLSPQQILEEATALEAGLSDATQNAVESIASEQ